MRFQTNRMVVRGFIVGFLLLLILGITIPILVLRQLGEENDIKNYKNLQVSGSVDNFPSAFGLIVICYAVSIDVTALSMRMHFNLQPFGSIGNSGNLLQTLQGNGTVSESVFRSPTQPLNVTFGDKVVNFPANQIMSSQEVVISALTGDSSLFPIDKYEFQFEISGSVHDPAGNSSSKNVPLPVFVGSQNTLPLFLIGTSVSVSDFAPSVSLTFQRSNSCKGFTSFVMALMWSLSILMFTLAVGMWIRGRKVEPPTIAASLGLLFALPGLRNAQPGVPVTVGTISDFIGFYWCMVLAGISCGLLILNYIVKYRAEKKKPKVEDEKDKKFQTLNPQANF